MVTVEAFFIVTCVGSAALPRDGPSVALELKAGWNDYYGSAVHVAVAVREGVASHYYGLEA